MPKYHIRMKDSIIITRAKTSIHLAILLSDPKTMGMGPRRTTPPNFLEARCCGICGDGCLGACFEVAGTVSPYSGASGVANEKKNRKIATRTSAIPPIAKGLEL